MSKFIRRGGQISNHQQSGITLIVAILLLASVTFISFALSTIILREIGAARLLLRSEPAISGANAGGEVALFQLLREAGSIGTSGQLPESGASYQVTANLYDDPYLFTVSPQATITVGLYDAENPANQTTGYGSVTISNNPGGQPIVVSIISWSQPEVILYSQTLGVGQSSSQIPLDSFDDRYLITITNNTAAGLATGQVQAFDESDPPTPKGVPSNTPDLQVTGTSGNVQRKIEINLSSPPP
ncbi:MAG: hypothetical protein HYW88_03495 [Candidatus Sungbacteria bacterium]|nr:hypothetical protein [Candidatus Sungbacteria bacterium]